MNKDTKYLNLRISESVVKGYITIFVFCHTPFDKHSGKKKWAEVFSYKANESNLLEVFCQFTVFSTLSYIIRDFSFEN